MPGSIIGRLCALAFVALAVATGPARAAEVHPGQAVYDRACAACHNAAEPGSRAWSSSHRQKPTASYQLTANPAVERAT